MPHRAGTRHDLITICIDSSIADHDPMRIDAAMGYCLNLAGAAKAWVAPPLSEAAADRKYPTTGKGTNSST